MSSGGAFVRTYPTNWPRGPWKSKEAAQEALDRWVQRRNLEALWGTIRAAHHIQIIGPFRTREIARRADIFNWPYLLNKGK